MIYGRQNDLLQNESEKNNGCGVTIDKCREVDFFLQQSSLIEQRGVLCALPKPEGRSVVLNGMLAFFKGEDCIAFKIVCVANTAPALKSMCG
jgi:hypothetical protein